MKKQAKRFITRQYFWVNAIGTVNRTWNIWDKKECKWMNKYGYYGRENALMWADKFNQEAP